jgi:cytochrome c oxidase assembly factor CtaG
VGLALTRAVLAAGACSFAAHMLEHEVLLWVAAPLMVLSRPGGVLRWGLPDAARARVGAALQGRRFRAAWRAVSAPLPATTLQLLALFGWHAPGPFGLALASEGWHAVQHLCFFASALLFWNAMFARPAAARMPAVVGCLFVTSIVGGALGAFMALSTSPWYAAYRALQLSAFGLSPVQDQQLAGLLMWIPGGLVHAVAGLALLVRGMRPAAGAPLRTAP